MNIIQSISGYFLGDGTDGVKELNDSRRARLDKVQALFKESKFKNLDELKNSLSSSAEFADVSECVDLPYHKYKKRYYTAEDTPADQPKPSKYSMWIDRVWNKDTLSFPLLICRVAQPSDVVKCMNFARENNLRLSVAGGCHSATAMVDGAFTIDMINMNDVAFDASTNEFAVGAGATLSKVDTVTIENGRFIPVGTNGDTGVAGLTLSGGNGWFNRFVGYTVDNLLAIDIITADGTLHENIRDGDDADRFELLWACRGGGGNFGIVTKFTFNSHPCPNNNQYLLGTVVSLAPTTHQKVQTMLEYYKQVCATSNDTNGFLVLPAGAPVVPVNWFHVGPKAPEGAKAVPQLDDLKNASNLGGIFNVANKWEVINHQKLQTLIASEQRHGYLYQTFIGLTNFDETVCTFLVNAIYKAPKGSIFIMMPSLGVGKDTDPDNIKTCLSTRKAKMWVLLESKWSPEHGSYAANRQKSRDWCKSFVKEINETLPDSVAKTTHAFSDARDENAGEGGNNALTDMTNVEVARRLRAAKLRYDPDNLLANNRVISKNK